MFEQAKENAVAVVKNFMRSYGVEDYQILKFICSTLFVAFSCNYFEEDFHKILHRGAIL